MRLDEMGVTPRKAAQFQKRGIESAEDLLRFYPRDYRDFTHVVSTDQLTKYAGCRVTALGSLTHCKLLQGRHVVARLKGNGGSFCVIWFNQAYRMRQLTLGTTYVVGGLVQCSQEYRSASFPAPDLFETFEGLTSGIKPVYRKIPGMSEEYFADAMQKALECTESMTDELSDDERQTLDVPCIAKALWFVHMPQSMDEVRQAQRRILVDEMIPFCREMELKKAEAAKESPFVPRAAFDTMAQVQSILPYKLTDNQSAALDKMIRMMQDGKRLDVLLQGDVGCGKTVVAVILAACLCRSGYQVAVVCPTSVLAGQHYREFASLLGELGIGVAHLDGGAKAGERKKLLKKIKNGEVGVVVGTHALFSADVEFKALGLTVTDEEHRFGVKQKEALRQKAAQGVHNVSMSATPIPRSLAVTMYGEGTEIINIKTLPSGRKPVKTILYSNEPKVYQSMLNQIHEGHQCYVVCPLIEDSEDEKMSGVDSVETTMQKMADWFGRYPQVHIESLTGGMKQQEMDAVIGRFAAGQTHILVSTTVVEVGVNVPNATVMLIKNAERFGLAQLHQLRGRVGRSDLQSYCVLLSKQRDNERLNTMVATNDGFQIAQKDMELRGTGQVLGVRQSGFDRCVDLMLQNPDLYGAIRAVVRKKNEKSA